MTALPGRGDVHPPASLPLLECLRSATADAHAELEGRLRLLDADSSTERYCRFLQATFEVLSAVDVPLSEYLGELYRLPGSESRVAKLQRDIEAFGGRPQGTDPLVEVRSPAAAFGAGYVMQGSLLGGAVIVRHMRQCFGLGDSGTGYLTSYGDGIGTAWRRFTRGLDAFGRDASLTERVVAVAAAEQTFEAFSMALARHGFAD